MTIRRISSLPRANVCPASWATIDDAGAPNITSDAARMGDAFHRVMEQRTNPLDTPGAKVNLLFWARQYGVPHAELAELVENSTFDPVRPGARAEVTRYLNIRGPAGDMILVPGHVDWEWPDADNRTIHVFDYKTTSHPEGSLPILEDAQLMGYAVAAAQHHVDLITEGWTVTVTKHYPRAPRVPAEGEFGQYETVVMDREALDSAYRWLEAIVTRASAQYHVPPERRDYRPNNYSWSVNCRGCAGLQTCPAVRAGIAAYRSLDCGVPLTTALAEQWKDTYPWKKIADHDEENLRAAVKLVLQQTGQPIPLDDKYELTLAKRGFPVATKKQETIH